VNDKLHGHLLNIRRECLRLAVAVRVQWKVLILFAIVSLGLLCLAITVDHYAISTNPNIPSSPWLETIGSVITSLAASAIWFGIAIVFYREYLLTVREYPSLDDFPLDTFIRISNRIEVSVHGWDGLMVGQGQRANLKTPMNTRRGQTWKTFFDNLGTLILILPQLPSAQASNIEANEAIEEDLNVIGRRNDFTRDRQIQEIEDTIATAQNIAGDNGVVEVRWCTHLRWACTIRFDDRWLLISPYTQHQDGAPFCGPVLLINLNGYASTRRWVEMLHSRDK
jgi:hypothetical protein